MQRRASQLDLLTLGEACRGVEPYLPFVASLCVAEPLSGLLRSRSYAVLLYGREPQRVNPDAFASDSAYQGEDRTDPFARRIEIPGSPLDQAGRLKELLGGDAVTLFDKTDLEAPNADKVPAPRAAIRHANHGIVTSGGERASRGDVASPATRAARAWGEVYELLDLQLSPLGLRAIEALEARAGDGVIDVGCGAGQSSLQLAERVGVEGRVIGVDRAGQLLGIARQRGVGLHQLSWLRADAERLGLRDRSADRIFSRLGVMAFANPVGAFTVFRRILRPGGRLAFVCWRALRENELDWLPLRAAGLESRVDSTPFRFADAASLRATLEAAGFEDVTLRASDESVSSGGLEEMLTVLLRVGPLGRILREHPELRAAAEPRVRAVLSDRLERGVVALRAATWVVAGRRGS